MNQKQNLVKIIPFAVALSAFYELFKIPNWLNMFVFFFLHLEPTYITIGPPTCELLVNCTLTEKDCIYSFKLDQNGCRICQCKTSEYAKIQCL